MKTYLKTILNSEGASAREVAKVLEGLGFTTALGHHDHVYDWGKKDRSVEEVLNFLEKVHNALKGMNVQYEVTTL